MACAGSLLGLAFGHQGFSFPVGKVDHMNMYPVTFSEFLEQRDARLYQYYMSIDSLEPLPDVFLTVSRKPLPPIAFLVECRQWL